MRDVQTLQQLPGGNSKLATLNLQRARRNLQLATCNWAKISASHSHFALSAVTTHVQVASCLLQLQLMLMNCCCPTFPLVAPSSSSLLWRVASRLAYIFFNLPSSLFRFDQLDRPYLIAATCRHVVCLKDITIPDLCVCSGHKSSSAQLQLQLPFALHSPWACINRQLQRG